MIRIADLKEFRQLETGQCKAAIYFDEAEAEVFFSIKKKMKEGQAVQLISTSLVVEGEKSNNVLDTLYEGLKTALEKAYEAGRKSVEPPVIDYIVAKYNDDKFINPDGTPYPGLPLEQ